MSDTERERVVARIVAGGCHLASLGGLTCAATAGSASVRKRFSQIHCKRHGASRWRDLARHSARSIRYRVGDATSRHAGTPDPPRASRGRTPATRRRRGPPSAGRTTAGESGTDGTGVRSATLRKAEHALHDDADVHVARPRPEQDEPALSARAVRHDRSRARGSRRDRRRCRDCRERWRGPGTTAASAARRRAAARRRLPRRPRAGSANARRAQLKPSRDDSHLRGRLAREAGRELLLEQCVGRYGRGGPSVSGS